jgi:tetratricopeptide (TPR) repeat protein
MVQDKTVVVAGRAPTRLAVFFDSLMEGASIFAVALVPIFFNIFAAQSFEPDKALLIRSLGLIGFFALVARFVEGGIATEGRGTRIRTFLSIPLVAPLLLLLAVNVASSLFSVLPETSFWGSYERRQGLYVLLACAAIFFVIVRGAGRAGSLRRLTNAIVLTSLPIAVYAIMQAWNAGAVTGEGGASLRVAATFGNPIFLGAYLIMVIPLTLSMLVEAFLDPAGGTGRPGTVLVPAGLFGAIFGLQLVAFALTQSRGPFLGLVAAFYLFGLAGLLLLSAGSGEARRLGMGEVGRALLFAVVSIPVAILPAYLFFLFRKKGFRWLWLSMVFHGVIVLLLVILVVMGGPVSAKKGIPLAGRLGTVFDLQSGTAKVRLLIWDGAIRLVKSSAPRSLIGYGPETMKYVWGRFSTPELAVLESRDATADRSHNETLDTLVNSGVAGLVAYYLFFVAILYYGFQWLGFLVVKRQRAVFAFWLAAGGLGGFLAPRLYPGLEALSFVGLPAGIVAGAVLHVITTGLAFPVEPKPGAGRQRLLLLGLLCGLVAHFAEAQSGVTVAATRLYFFVLAAAMVVVAHQGAKGRGVEAGITAASAREGDRNAPRTAGKKEKRTGGEGKVPSQGAPATPRHPSPAFPGEEWPATLLLAAMLFSLVFPNVIDPRGDGDVLSAVGGAFSRIYVGAVEAQSAGMSIILLATMAAALFLLYGDATKEGIREGRPAQWIGRAALGALASVVLLIAGLLVEALFIQPGYDIGKMAVYYFAALCLLLGGFALLLRMPGEGTAASGKASWRWGLYPVLALCTVWFAVASNVDPARADIYQRFGKQAEKDYNFRDSLAWYGRAVSTDGGEPMYLGALARAAYGGAVTTANTEERRALLEKSRVALERARAMNPLDADHLANLGLLYGTLSLFDKTPEARAATIETSDRFFREATRLSPFKASIYNVWARACLQRGDYDGALALLKRSLEIDGQYAATHRLLGEVQARRGRYDEAIPAFNGAPAKAGQNVDALLATAHSLYRQGKLDEAMKMAVQAAQASPQNVNAHMLLNILYFKAGRMEDALREGLTVLKISPQHLNAHRNVAVTYVRLGRYDLAQKHLEQAFKLAPDSEKAAIKAQLDQLRTQPQQSALPKR